MILGVYLPVCLYSHNNSKSNEQNFLIFFIWVGSDERKKSLNFGKALDHFLDTKKNTNFQRSHFQCI